MEINQQNGTLTVTGLSELNSANARAFRDAVSAALSPDLQTIEIDLSQMQSVDGAGLGALVLLYETANDLRSEGVVVMRLTNPSPPVLQMIELARLHHLFELTPPGGKPDETLASSTYSSHETDSSPVHLH
jgi:anti-anti-sigma factor